MRRFLQATTAIVFLSLVPMTAGAQETCRSRSTVIVDLSAWTLSLPAGQLTDEFAQQGIVFSTDDTDLPPAYQQSTGSQENQVVPLIEGSIRGPFEDPIKGIVSNLFRIDFTRGNVISASVTLRDGNTNLQVHTLTAFDSDGNVLDQDTLKETNAFEEDRFDLTVSSCAGIASIVALEQPLGAEAFDRLTFTLGR